MPREAASDDQVLRGPRRYATLKTFRLRRGIYELQGIAR